MKQTNKDNVTYLTYHENQLFWIPTNTEFLTGRKPSAKHFFIMQSREKAQQVLDEIININPERDDLLMAHPCQRSLEFLLSYAQDMGYEFISILETQVDIPVNQ